MATSNETKMKGKARVAEKNPTPLFNVVKAVSEEANTLLEDKSDAEEVIQYANPLPLEGKPRQTRGRKPKAKPAPEAVAAPEPAAAPTEEVSNPEPPKKRRGRPKKQPVAPEVTPVETVAKEPDEAPKGSVEDRQLSIDVCVDD